MIKKWMKFISNQSFSSALFDKARSSNKSEFQTARLFATLGVLTIIFVLFIRWIQNGPNQILSPSQRIPTTINENMNENLNTKSK